jgi:hypothetical protein
MRIVVEFLKDKIGSKNHLQKLSSVWDELIEITKGDEFCSCSIETIRNTDKLCRMFECCNRKAQEHITLKEAIKIYQYGLDQYGLRALQAEKNENIDWKAVMHAIRACYQGIELLRDHHITFPRPERDLLLQIRKGDIAFNNVSDMLQLKFEELENAMTKSILPDKPNLVKRDELVMQVYQDRIKKG